MRCRRATALALVLAFLAGAAVSSAFAQGPVLQGLRGERLSEADLAQGTTIFIVWASWSPHSRDVVDRANRVAQRWSGKARVVTVNFQEDRGAVEGFLAGKSLSPAVFLDGDGAFSKKYAVATLPGLLVIKDGRVAYRGKLPEDPDRVIVEILP
ncbi:MAG TPA: TlpA disulfide reductase family protein [Thermoanaerobaculia bacterium]|nr:TlpA disulfide reductase family protein [Thermoanaerobaculia bacterium]